MKVYRVHLIERELGWHEDYIHRDFATFDEADAFYVKTNKDNSMRTDPHYRLEAESIEEIGDEAIAG